MSYYPPPTPNIPYATPTQPYGVRNPDLDHLRILSICHYVYAGLVFLFGCLGLFYVAIGIAMSSGKFPFGPATQPSAREAAEMSTVGTMLATGGGILAAISWIAAILILIAGRKLARHRGYTFTLILAGFCCLNVPLGTILGVFTFIVLLRPSVKQLYDFSIPRPA